MELMGSKRAKATSPVSAVLIILDTYAVHSKRAESKTELRVQGNAKCRTSHRAHFQEEGSSASFTVQPWGGASSPLRRKQALLDLLTQCESLKVKQLQLNYLILDLKRKHNFKTPLTLSSLIHHAIKLKINFLKFYNSKHLEN